MAPKATKNDTSAADAVEAQLQALCSEDNFGGSLVVVDDYPQLRTRALSLFEQDLRDWGYVYGLAFGLALSANPGMSHEDAARLAYGPARRVKVRWGGEIEDPGEKRENAIRAVVEQYDRRSETMTEELQNAIADLVESARA